MTTPKWSMTDDELQEIYDALKKGIFEYQPTLWERIVDRFFQVKRVLKGTIGWASFLGLFGVVGGMEQDSIGIGTGVILLSILAGLFIWSLDEFREDIQ